MATNDGFDALMFRGLGIWLQPVSCPENTWRLCGWSSEQRWAKWHMLEGATQNPFQTTAEKLLLGGVFDCWTRTNNMEIEELEVGTGPICNCSCSSMFAKCSIVRKPSFEIGSMWIISRVYTMLSCFTWKGNRRQKLRFTWKILLTNP